MAKRYAWWHFRLIFGNRRSAFENNGGAFGTLYITDNKSVVFKGWVGISEMLSIPPYAFIQRSPGILYHNSPTRFVGNFATTLNGGGECPCMQADSWRLMLCCDGLTVHSLVFTAINVNGNAKTYFCGCVHETHLKYVCFKPAVWRPLPPVCSGSGNTEFIANTAVSTDAAAPLFGGAFAASGTSQSFFCG
jgi:hypothetical protein